MLDKWLVMLDRLHEERLQYCEEFRKSHLLECPICIPVWDDFPSERLDCRSGKAFDDTPLDRYCLDDPTNVPVRDLCPPPESRVILPINAWTIVTPSSAEEIKHSLERIEKSRDEFPNETLPEPEPSYNPFCDDISELHRPMPIADEMHRRKMWLRMTFRIHDWLLTDDLCRDCSFEAVRSALCREARGIIRYREEFSYEDVDLLVEALASDALLRLCEECQKEEINCPEIVDQLLESPSPIHIAARALESKGLSVLDLAHELGTKTARHACLAFLDATKAAECVCVGDWAQGALAIHRAERERRLWWVTTWEPIALEGMAHERESDNRGKGTQEKAGVDGDKGRQRALLWAHFIVDYCERNKPRHCFGQACEKAGKTAFDQYGKVIAGKRPKKTLSRRTVRREVAHYFGLCADTVMDKERLPPLPAPPDPEAEARLEEILRDLRRATLVPNQPKS